MCSIAPSTPSTVLTAMTASRNSLAVVVGRGGLDARVGLLRRRVAAHLAAGVEQRLDQRRRDTSAGAALSTSRHSVAPQTPVRRILALRTTDACAMARSAARST